MPYAFGTAFNHLFSAALIFLDTLFPLSCHFSEATCFFFLFSSVFFFALQLGPGPDLFFPWFASRMGGTTTGRANASRHRRRFCIASFSPVRPFRFFGFLFESRFWCDCRVQLRRGVSASRFSFAPSRHTWSAPSWKAMLLYWVQKLDLMDDSGTLDKNASGMRVILPGSLAMKACRSNG
jgi:hypothetical protein